MYVSTKLSGNDLPAAREVIVGALDLLQTEWDKNVKLSAATYPHIVKIESCNLFGGRRSMDDYEREVKGSSYYSSRPSIERVVEHATKIANEWKNTAEARHVINLPGLASNVKLTEALKILMTSIGMPATYSAREETRSRVNRWKSVSHSSGYLGDISRNIICHDGYEQALAEYKVMTTYINDYANKRRDEEEKIKREAATVAKTKEDLRAVGVLLGKYGLSVDKDANDLLEAILSKDKYLRLAHYLALNRGDWNDGYSYAKAGLRGFNATTEDDVSIVEEIQSLINVDDLPDGRCFRDCTWNYTRLFSMVATDLKTDYDKVTGMTE